MTREDGRLAHITGVWAEFWYAPPPLVNLGLMRLGTGLVLMYVLLVRSYDLDTLLSAARLADPETMAGLARYTAPFPFFAWSTASGWLWSVHVLAISVAAAFSLGIYTGFTGALGILFLWSYAAQNPAVLLGLDGLLVTALFYLTLAPSDRALTVLWWRVEQFVPVAPRPIGSKEEPPPRPWHGLPVRVLQIHLCLLYFQSALGKINHGWLQGAVLEHPRVLEAQAGIAPDVFFGGSVQALLWTNLVVLFELFYGLLVWLPGFRWVVLAGAVVMHLWIGVAWDKLPFNFLMILLNLVFLPPRPLNWIAERARWALIDLVALARAAR